jgi:hypothetical protein
MKALTGTAEKQSFLRKKSILNFKLKNLKKSDRFRLTIFEKSLEMHYKTFYGSN